ncbi:MAG: STAS domain-containing protein [Phycisphaerales bacterium]
MKFSFEDHGPTTVLTLSGQLTSDQADSFRRGCIERFAQGVRNVVLNLEHLTLIDSAGLEMLLWLRDELSTHQGQLRLVQVDDTIHKILEVTRLTNRFAVHDSVESAAKSLR